MRQIFSAFSAVNSVEVDDGNFNQEEASDDESVTSAAAGTRVSTRQVDKDYVRARVKTALHHEGKNARRRIRVKGEASAVTRNRRDIAQSLKECPVWGYD